LHHKNTDFYHNNILVFRAPHFSICIHMENHKVCAQRINISFLLSVRRYRQSHTIYSISPPKIPRRL
jgi:hypothetical protein